MNRTFTPVCPCNKARGTGMKYPNVPKVIIGSELNGFVQGDLMDANAVSQYIAEKISSSSSSSDYQDLYNRITKLLQEDTAIHRLINDIVSDINSLGTITDHIHDIQTIEVKLLQLYLIVSGYIRPTVKTNDDGDLILNL